MELRLKQSNSKEPVILFYESVEGGKKVKKTTKLHPGETIEVSDDDGYNLLGNPNYRSVVEVAEKKADDSYQKKVLRNETNKGL
jgi:hypothetical protein